MDWIPTYVSSLLVSLGPICEDDNGTKWWELHVTGTASRPSYHFSVSGLSTLNMLFLQIPKNLINTSFHSHINLGWLCNLRFDYSKTFGGFNWLNVVLTAPPMPSKEALIYSVLILKACSWEHKRSYIKFL